MMPLKNDDAAPLGRPGRTVTVIRRAAAAVDVALARVVGDQVLADQLLRAVGGLRRRQRRVGDDGRQRHRRVGPEHRDRAAEDEPSAPLPPTRAQAVEQRARAVEVASAGRGRSRPRTRPTPPRRGGTRRRSPRRPGLRTAPAARRRAPRRARRPIRSAGGANWSASTSCSIGAPASVPRASSVRASRAPTNPAAAGDQELHRRTVLSEVIRAAARCCDHAALLQAPLAAQDVLRGAASRRGGVAPRDRVDDGTVLVAHLLHEVGAARLVAARDAHRLAQILLEEGEQAAELRVAGGFADGAVKGQVLGDAVATLGFGLRRSRRSARRNPAICARVARSAASAAISPSSTRRTSHHLQHRLDRLEHARVEGERLVRRPARRRTRPSPGASAAGRAT